VPQPLDIQRVLADSPLGRPISPTFPDARASAVLVASGILGLLRSRVRGVRRRIS